MALSAKVAANTVIQVVSKVLSTALSLVAVALVTRYLGSYGFGQYTTAITFATFLSIAGDLGLTMVTTQLISRPGADQARILSNLFTFRIVSAAAIIGLGPLLVLFFPYDPVVKEGVFIASLAFFFVLLCQIFVSLFQRELRTDKIAWAEVGSRVLLVGATAAAVFSDWGVSGVLWAMAAANAASFVLHYLFARPFARIGLKYDRAVWIDILKRSWPLVLTIVLNLVYLKTDTLLLSLLRSQEDVGLYGAAYKVVDVLVTIPFMLGGTILPILVARWQSRDRAAYGRAWQRVFDASIILVSPMVIGGWLLAEPIMTIMAGSEFAAAGDILKILILAVGFIFFSAFFSYTMISFDKQKAMISAYLVTAATALILYLIFIPRYSYIAAAWITVYSEVAITFLAWRLVRRHGELRIRAAVGLKAIASAFVMGAILWLLPLPTGNIIGLLSEVALGGIIYAGLLYGIGGITRVDVRALLRRPPYATP